MGSITSKLVVAGVIVALAAGLYWRHSYLISSLEAEREKSSKLANSYEFLQATREIEQTRYDQVQQAEQAAAARAEALESDLDSVRNESDGLRKQLAATRARVSTAPRAAAVETAFTLSELFEDCERRYREMAAKADRHANDAQTIIEAWPDE